MNFKNRQNNRKNKSFLLALLLAVLLIAGFTTGCASTPKKGAAAHQALFEYYTLDNGIPLIVKKNTASKVVAARFIIQNAHLNIPQEKSGVENLLLTLMGRGSTTYSYTDIQTLAYQTQLSRSVSTTNSGSVVAISVIDHYVDTVLPVVIDTLLNPLLDGDEFKKMMVETQQGLQATLNDPFSLLKYTANDILYKNHPYNTKTSVTPESINKITLQDLKDHHKNIVNAKNLTIVVVGDVDGAKMRDTLNKSLGSLPGLPAPKKPAIPPLNPQGEPTVLTHEAAANTGYVLFTFNSPDLNDADYMAAAVAASLYNELLFNVVREQHGACYSIGTSVGSEKAGSYGNLYVYKVSDLPNIALWIQEAENLMAQGKIIASKDEKTGDFVYTTIADRLEGYKNAYINRFFAKRQTNDGVAGNIAGDLLFSDNPEAYTTVVERIRKVSADDVQKAFTKYWVQSPGRWFIITGPNDTDKIKLETFK